MRIGMPTLVGLPSIGENAALCAALGLDFVELNLNLPCCADVGALDADALRALMDKHSIFFTLHLDERMDVCDFNPLVRQAYLETARRALRLAMALSMPSVNLHMNPGIYFTLPDRKVRLYAEQEALYARSLTAFRDMVTQTVGGAPLRVHLENTDGWLPFERRGVELLLQSPCFGLTLDVGHLHAAKDADADFFKAHSSRLHHLHLHDAQGSRNHLQLGTGELDLNGILRLAQAHGCTVVTEVKTAESLTQSVQWLRENGWRNK